MIVLVVLVVLGIGLGLAYLIAPHETRDERRSVHEHHAGIEALKRIGRRS